MSPSRLQRRAALAYGLLALLGAGLNLLLPRGAWGELHAPFQAALHQGFLPVQLLGLGLVGLGLHRRRLGRSWYGVLTAAALLGCAEVGFRLWLSRELPVQAVLSGGTSLALGLLLGWAWLRGDARPSSRPSLVLSMVAAVYVYLAVGYQPFGILVNAWRQPGVHLEDLPRASPFDRHSLEVEGRTLHAWYGELHGHTWLSVDARQSGSGGPDEYYPYARDVAGLDFAALTEHDSPGGISDNPDLWRKVCALADAHHDPGRFVTFKAFEWTSGEGHHEALRDLLGLDKARFHEDRRAWGHRNVFFPTAEVPAHLPSHLDADADEPHELWAFLREHDALAVPHHPLGGPVPAFKWESYDPEVEGIVELYSAHGNSEATDAPYPLYNAYTEAEVGTRHAVVDALDIGYTFGLIGATDTHMGWGGNGTTTPEAARPEQLIDFLHQRYGSAGAKGGGLAGVYAPELTRASLWEALRARRTFATTGPRMVAWLEAGGHFMGSVAGHAGPEPVEVRIGAEGTADLVQLELVSNGGEVLHRWPPEARARSVEATWTDPRPLTESRWYYLRVTQADGELAWSSPVRLEPSGP